MICGVPFLSFITCVLRGRGRFTARARWQRGEGGGKSLARHFRFCANPTVVDVPAPSRSANRRSSRSFYAGGDGSLRGHGGSGEREGAKFQRGIQRGLDMPPMCRPATNVRAAARAATVNEIYAPGWATTAAVRQARMRVLAMRGRAKIDF